MTSLLCACCNARTSTPATLPDGSTVCQLCGVEAAPTNSIARQRLNPSSWVIVDRSTGEAVAELFLASSVDRLNSAKYDAVPILDWLQRLNRSE